MSQPQSETLLDLIRAGDAERLGEHFYHHAKRCNGTVKVRPADIGWADYTLNAGVLKSAEADPVDMDEAMRWCILVSDIPECDADTAALAYMDAETGLFNIFTLSGPTHDHDVAKYTVARDLNLVQADDLPVGPKWADRKRRLRTVTVDATPPLAANDNTPPLPAMHPDPFSPEAAGGLLGDIARWTTETAIIKVPELSLAAAIALMGGVFGKLALGPTRAGVNLYLTTLLGTAGGKGHPPKSIRAVADKVGAAGAVTNGDPTSYAALERMLRKNPSTVVVMDEFGITLQDVNGRNRNSVAASIRKFLLAVYDQANSVFDGRVYASSETKKDEAPIQGPALTVLAMTTIETLYAGLSEASIADGFLNRFLFITAAKDIGKVRPPRLDSDTTPPVPIIDALKQALLNFPRNGVPGHGSKHVVPFEGGEDGEAYKRWGEVFLWQQSAGLEIAGRAAENTVRLATIRAISRNPAEPAVNVEDVEWAWAIVHTSLGIIVDGIERHMAASPGEALRKAIIAALRTAKDQTLAFSHLVKRKGVSGAEMYQLEDALRWLIAAGVIMDTACKPKPGAGSNLRLLPVATD